MNTIEEYMLRNTGGKDADPAGVLSTPFKQNQDKPDKEPEKPETILPQVSGDPVCADYAVSAAAGEGGVVFVQDNATPAAKAAAQKALAAGVGAAVRKSANLEPDDVVRLKLEKLRHVEGFDDLMKSIRKNPAVADMFKRLTDGSAVRQESALDGILEQTDKDPQFFRKMLRAMKEKPGSINTLAAHMANDLDGGGLAKPGVVGAAVMDGSSQILDTIFRGEGLDKVICSFLEVPGENFAASRHLLEMSNKGPGQVVDFINGAGAKPQSIVVVDPHSGHLATRSAAELSAWAEAQSAIAAASASSRESVTSKLKVPQS